MHFFIPVTVSTNQLVDVGICLVGDSLLTKSVKSYNLTERLREDLCIRLSQYEFSFHTDSVGHIADFYDTHNGVHIAHNAQSRYNCDLMVLLWDSDIADFHEELLSPDNFVVHRMNYTTQLTFFSESVKAEGLKLFISGLFAHSQLMYQIFNCFPYTGF
jgi:hypothetical protein